VIVSRSVQALSGFFESLVHVSARGEALLAARHKSFIASHLIAGLVALLIFPIYLAIWGRPSPATAFAFAWFLSPVLIALWVSRTGRLVAAHFASAANLVGLCAFAALLTGGVGSFLIAWMAIAPMEAALSANRKAVLWATTLACAALLGLAVATATGSLPPPQALAIDPVALALLGVGSATVYGAGLALSVQTVYATSEEAVRLGERRYRLMAENATDMLTRHDARGRVTFASVAAEPILGAPAGALMGDGLFERVHVADRPAYLTALSCSLSQRTPYTVEFRVRRGGEARAKHSADGYVWVEMRCRPMSREGEIDGAVVAVTRDIGERKAQEEELMRARDAAQSASRAKSQFLANMSHELRTPLNAVIGFSEILNRELYGPLGDPRYLDYAALIHESGQHLLTVVNDVLDMSKIEAGKFTIVKEHFDPVGLLQSSAELMRDLASRKGVELRVEPARALPELVADKRACKQMLLNLLSNAIKFTDQGGLVRLSAASEGGLMRLSVKDNGIGIPQDDIARLGAPFVQANTSYNRKHEGAGLGLSVVKGLAQLHGGALEIESVEGQGAMVSVLLPLDADATPATEDAPLRLSA
jgi:cell cycle sensor histidine kinase DivJ